MQIVRIARLAAILGPLAVACKTREAPPPPPPPRAQILKDVPPIPLSTLVDTTGTVDAERRTFELPARFDSTAAFYRGMLPRLGWQTVNDRSDLAGGKVDLYLRKGSQTLWVHVEKTTDRSARYTLLASDSAMARP